jgi:hypothetical protein
MNKTIIVEIQDKTGLASRDFFTLYVFYHTVGFFLDKIKAVQFKNDREQEAAIRAATRLQMTLANQIPFVYRDKFKVDLTGTIRERK